MKKTLQLITFFLVISNLFGQDIIVMKDGDTLNCKISNAKDNFIYFKYKDGEKVNSTIVPVGRTKMHQFGYFLEKSKVSRNQFVKFRLGIDVGEGYLTAPLNDNLSGSFKDYAKDLKKGNNYGLSGIYFFDIIWGTGFQYHFFHTKNAMYSGYGIMADNINIHYIGPSICIKQTSYNADFHTIFDVSIGYTRYVNNTDRYTIKGWTIGMTTSLYIDYMMTRSLALGIRLTYFFSRLSNYTSDGAYNPSAVSSISGYSGNISRFDISIGLRYYK